MIPIKLVGVDYADAYQSSFYADFVKVALVL